MPSQFFLATNHKPLARRSRFPHFARSIPKPLSCSNVTQNRRPQGNLDPSFHRCAPLQRRQRMHSQNNWHYPQRLRVRTTSIGRVVSPLDNAVSVVSRAPVTRCIETENVEEPKVGSPTGCRRISETFATHTCHDLPRRPLLSSVSARS
jgi:hypothetical protein